MRFVDTFNRLHTKPLKHVKDLPTNNAYIYTAYYFTMYPEQTYLGYVPQVVPFKRHPAPKEDEAGNEFAQNLPNVSHDEVMGVCMLSSDAARRVCRYLSRSFNQFCEHPDFKPKPWYKLNLFSTIKRLRQLSKEANPRTAVINYPDLWYITFWQKPNYRWTYQRLASFPPSIFERIWFLLASLVSIWMWKKSDPNLLLAFSQLHLQNKKLEVGIEGKLINLLVWRKIYKMYGNIPNMLLFKAKDLSYNYYHKHPWITGKFE